MVFVGRAVAVDLDDEVQEFVDEQKFHVVIPWGIVLCRMHEQDFAFEELGIVVVLPLGFNRIVLAGADGNRPMVQAEAVLPIGEPLLQFLLIQQFLFSSQRHSTTPFFTRKKLPIRIAYSLY